MEYGYGGWDPNLVSRRGFQSWGWKMQDWCPYQPKVLDSEPRQGMVTSWEDFEWANIFLP